MLVDRHHAGADAATLLVLLPPAQARPADFVDQGFVAQVRALGLPVDIALPDVGLDHALRQQGATALHEQVVAPALAAGRRAIWLAGISLGACHALHYAAQHAEALAGLVLLAPYPGTGDILLEIEQAGSPRAWAGSLPVAVEHERIWWRWLCAQPQAPGSAPRIDFAAGRQDRFARGQRLLAGLLPEPQVHWDEGGHDWPTWQRLWRHWLGRGLMTGT
jgi:pimeloyl-ACP methyl ester carboxylesterase